MHKAQYPVQRTFYCTRKMSDDIDKLSAETRIGKSEMMRRAIATYLIEKAIDKGEPNTLL